MIGSIISHYQIEEEIGRGGMGIPNVCGIYDIGETDDGKRYIAMPYYDGSSLEARIDAALWPSVRRSR